MIVKTALNVPDSLWAEVCKGNLIREGGVIRNPNGQIVKLVPGASIEPSCHTLSTDSKPSNNISTSKVIGCITAAVGITALIGYGVYKLVNSQKKEKYIVWGEPVSNYLIHTRSSNLTLKDITDAQNELNQLSKSDISSISKKPLLVLRSLLISNTKQLFKLNECRLDCEFSVRDSFVSKLDKKPKILQDSLVALQSQETLFYGIPQALCKIEDWHF